jgi:hypothetical protein
MKLSHHLQILGQCKLPEEREFYLRGLALERSGRRRAATVNTAQLLG